MITFKTKAEKKGGHVHVRFYSGPDEEHLALNGRLVFTIEEWLLFREMLLIGASGMSGVTVITQGYLTWSGVESN